MDPLHSVPADEGMPFGRLQALCPHGHFREQPTRAALLAKKRRYNSVSLYDIDLLAVRDMYNIAFSPLCRLPDEVLVRIMGHLDWLDMLCIRRTSRLFLRLFGRDEFSHLHDNNTGLFDHYTPWMAPALPIQNKDMWLKMAGRLRGESYDASCAVFSTGFKNIYLHCWACAVDHHVCLFSAAQRKESMDGRRICVAHEGHVRLCKHKTVKLSTVSRCLPGGRIQNKYRVPQNNPGSTNPGLTAAYNYFYGQPRNTGEDSEDSAPFLPGPDLRIVCEHPSHMPEHHQHSHPNATNCENAVGPTSPSTPPLSLPPPYERFPADECSDFPSFVVHDMIVSGTKYKVVTWSYTAHMDLSGLGDPSNNNAITAQTFRDCVQKLRKGHSPARYIAPEDHPGILQELRCVDPNRCSCLVYPGFSRGEQGYNKRTNDRQQTEKTASNGDFLCCEHQVTRAMFSRVSDLDNIHVRLVSCDCQDRTRCLKVIYTRTIRLQGFYVDPAPNWAPALSRGRRLNERDIQLRLQDGFRRKSVPYGWYQALDPRSYGLNKDTEKYTLTWCRGKRCKLNVSFLRENYVASQEMNAACSYGCQAGPWIRTGGRANPVRNLSYFEVAEKEQWDRWKHSARTGEGQETFQGLFEGLFN